MNSPTKNQHSIDILFVLTLFCVLAISSLAVVYMGSNIYSKTVDTMDTNFSIHVVLDYLTEKVHQGNANNQIMVQDMDGLNVLCIQETYEEQSYTTYIYYDNKQLKELFIPSDSLFKKGNGEVIMTLDALSLQIHGSVLQVYVSNNTKSHIIHVSLIKGDLSYETSQ